MEKENKKRTLSDLTKGGLNVFYQMNDLEVLGMTGDTETIEAQDIIREKLGLPKKERGTFGAKLTPEQKKERLINNLVKKLVKLGYTEEEASEQIRNSLSGSADDSEDEDSEK